MNRFNSPKWLVSMANLIICQCGEKKKIVKNGVLSRIIGAFFFLHSFAGLTSSSKKKKKTCQSMDFAVL